MQTYISTEAERNSYLSMKVPKSSLMVFCMFSVHSQLHWSFISRHNMFKATSATAVSAENGKAMGHLQTHDMTCCANKTHHTVESDNKEYAANVQIISGVLLHPSGGAVLLQADSF